MCCGTMHSRKVPAPGKGSCHVRCVKARQGYSSLEKGCHLALLRTREVGRGPSDLSPSPPQGAAHTCTREETLRDGPSASGPTGSPGRGESFPAAARHVTKHFPLPSFQVARAEVNTSTSSGRVFVFPFPSPQIGGRAHLRSGPGLCPGFPPSRAGRQGGRRRMSGQ